MAVPFQTRPVTSWNGRVAISLPDSSDPDDHETPQPRWQHSSACRITVGVAGAVEGVVGAAVGEPDEMLDDVAADLGRVDEMRHAEARGPIPRLESLMSTPTILSAPTILRALDDVEPDAAESEHHDVGARRDFRRY